MEMKKYDNYKDSGVEWIGNIPEKWSYSALKWYALIYSGGTPSKDVEDYWINGTIPWLNSGSVNQGDVIEASEFITEDALKNSSAKWVPNDSLIMALAGQGKTKGMVAQVKFNTTCNQSLGVIVPNEKIDNRYLLYWLRNNYQNIRNLGGGDKRDGLNLVMLGSIPIPIPNIKEQKSISNYLDHKTSQIDHLIAKKEQFIKLLEEERVAVINQAVTKGLDPNVPMKDSGVEWLGEIPKHWFIVPLKRVIEVRDGTHDTPEYVQNKLNSYPLITSKDFDGDKINFLNAKMISERDHLAISKRSGVKSGDVLMSMIGGNIGKSLIIGEQDTFSIKNVALFITRDNIFLAKYLRYYFDSGLLNKQIELKSRGGAQGFLSLGDIRNLIFFKFDFEELIIIIKYLDKKTAEISKVISKVKQEIDLLKEYKTALISEVVTGKVDVRNEKLN
jgi:type I restriction enzyme S subunit